MTDDIVTRLRNSVKNIWADYSAATGKWAMEEAADEIELLRLALRMACYEVFAYCDPLKTSPKELVAHFMNEAGRDEYRRFAEGEL